MSKIKISPRFKRYYQKLPVPIRAKVRKALKLLEETPRHPSLQTKPILGTGGIYEARIDQDYRLTYERLPEDSLFIRVVVKHDEALKTP